MLYYVLPSIFQVQFACDAPTPMMESEPEPETETTTTTTVEPDTNATFSPYRWPKIWIPRPRFNPNYNYRCVIEFLNTVQ